jgi:hypothetical protein
MLSVVDLLDVRGLDFTPIGTDEVAVVCPNAVNHQGGTDSRPSFNINTVKHVGHCFACGYSLRQEWLIRWLSGGDVDETELVAMGLRARLKALAADAGPVGGEKVQVFSPPGEPWDEDGYRGISIETYRKLGAMRVSRGRYENRIAFPIYLNGELIGIDARALGDQQPKYLRNKGSSCKENWLYPADLVRERRPNQVLLGEGIFDAINAIDKGYAGLSYFGVANWSMTKLRMLLSTGCDEVIYVRDNDLAGKKAEQQICATLVGWVKVSSAKVDDLPPGTDLGNMSAAQIAGAIRERTPIDAPACMPDAKPKFGARCNNRRCVYNNHGTCINEIWATA